MALVALDLDEGDGGAGGVQRMHDGAVLLRRKQPVGGEGDEAETRARAAEGLGQMPVMVGAEIDYKEDLQGAQFVIRNPNAATTCGCGSSFTV